VTTSAAPHATLGLDAYAQVTSPIRRYLDLVNQRQISAAVRGQEPPYTAQQLQELISGTQDALRRSMQVTRETRRFWLLKYLQRKQKRQEKIQGTVLRTDMKNPMVELEEIYIPVLIKKSASLQQGDELLLEISAVDPRRDYLKLSVVKKLD
jgi:exoribonuclease-2